MFAIYGCNQDSPNIQQIENMQFFIDNKKNDQLNELEPGLQYMIIDEGDLDGQSPKLNQTISAHFHGTLTNGEVFWTSIDGDPLTIELSKLIIGCQKTIALMKKGDKCFFYHSNIGKEIVGIVEVIKEAYIDKTDQSGQFVAFTVKFINKLERPITLENIKKIKELGHLSLIKQSRLSVMPIDSKSWKILNKMGKI